MNYRLVPFAATIVFCATALLGACGGSGSVSSSPSASTGTATSPVISTAEKEVVYQGPVTGFGSVIVNGIRFAENSATVQDEDGNAVARSALHLGTVLQVKGKSIDATSTGSATMLILLPSARGPITSINTSANTLTVMGATITVDSATVFEGASSLTALLVGDIIEVHGVTNANGIMATLVERRSLVSSFAVHGTVSGLNATAKTFVLGGLIIQYANSTFAPSNVVLANGQSVFVTSTNPSSAGSLVASKIRVRDHAGKTAAADSIVSFKGVVDALPDTSGKLTISGILVDTKTATFDNLNTFALGGRVMIRGQWVSDIFVASRITIEPLKLESSRNELFGVVSGLVDGTSFTVNGVSVDASSAIFSGGTAASLVNGTYAEVRGDVTPSANGSVLKATSVSIRSGLEVARIGDNDSSGSGRRGVYGAVHDFVSVSNFQVGTMTVDASAASVDHGVLTDIKNGAFVEIHANLINGVLKATVVEIQQSRSISTSSLRR
jgi:Domain of unknown function (DUF5666)